MANTIQYASLFQKELDKIALQEMLTGWMDANAGQVKYTGGKEVKIPKLSMDGLGNYGRAGNSGFADGDVSFSYQTKEMTQDRGRKFVIDANDVDETGFVVTASTIMGEFQRTKVTPEIDAYRLSLLAATAMGIAQDKNVEYGYTPSKDTVLAKLKYAIKVIRENGYNGQLVIHANYDVATEFELAMAGKISSTTFSQGGIDTEVPVLDGCPIIKTPQNRLYTAITLYDGKTAGQTQGGYVKGSTAKDVNFIILPRTTPIAVTKQDNMRIFDPETYQDANAWAMDYRRYHDIWVKDNAANSIFANIKETKSGS
ncbi:hypothetical protein [Clostridium intestinale]|uniref:Prophage protein n=1 Tax=Clostridium intestinale URNW TaxID=1294142 RepID=U2N674_9CLOT|nr:hypothetical protein [Clostridium intestinale]ERK31002.1 prophage protein [Clostridium intestinale URNW]